jgi:alkaline phosphatase D
MEEVVAAGAVDPDRSRDLTVSIVVGDLEPGTTYFYRFWNQEGGSPTGRTRTLPNGVCERVRLAFASCAKYAAGFFNAYAALNATDDVDFVVHLGDYAYQGGIDERDPGPRIGRALDPPHACVTIDDYRSRYALHRRDPDVQLLHQMFPIIAITDDNDICNGTYRTGAEKHDEATEGSWDDRKAAALRAWREWMPVRVREGEPLYRSFPFGDLADLVLLDERTMRDKMLGGRAMYAEDRSMLGPDQFAWLAERLKESTTKWRLVGNPVMIASCESELLPEEVGHPLGELGVITKRDHGPDPDQWDGYPAERDRLFELIREGDMKNVVFVSGDVHSSWANELVRDDDPEGTPPLAVEFVTTSVSSQNLDDRLGVPPRTKSLEIERKVNARNNQVRWLELDSHGYLTQDITPTEITTTWHFTDPPTTQSNNSHPAKQWKVKNGTPKLIEPNQGGAS